MSPTLENLATLVAFETESRMSNLDLVDWCAERASTLGASVEVLVGEHDRANVLVCFGPDEAGGVLLAGHSDVVPAGDGWSSSPYRLTRRSDAVIGRGTADMKGFIASALSVAERVDVKTFAAPLRIAISFDEEIGCRGVLGLTEHLRRSGHIKPDLVIVGEPTSMTVCNSHPGKLAYEITLAAEAGHGSRSLSLPSALLGAAHLALAVDDVQRHHALEHGHVSTNVGHIHGGAGVNVIAPRAEMSFELRYTAGLDPEELLTPVWHAVAEIRPKLSAVGGDIDVVETIRYPGLFTPNTHAVSLLAELAGTTELGSIGFGTEAGVYATVLDAPVVVCGPGNIVDAHRPDEFVSLEQLQRCDALLAALIQALCVEGSDASVHQ